jgi:hypothetical protein
MNWKRRRRKWAWRNLKYQPEVHPDELKKTMKIISQEAGLRAEI